MTEFWNFFKFSNVMFMHCRNHQSENHDNHVTKFYSTLCSMHAGGTMLCKPCYNFHYITLWRFFVTKPLVNNILILIRIYISFRHTGISSVIFTNDTFVSMFIINTWWDGGGWSRATTKTTVLLQSPLGLGSINGFHCLRLHQCEKCPHFPEVPQVRKCWGQPEAPPWLPCRHYMQLQ